MFPLDGDIEMKLNFFFVLAKVLFGFYVSGFSFFFCGKLKKLFNFVLQPFWFSGLVVVASTKAASLYEHIILLVLRAWDGNRKKWHQLLSPILPSKR